MVDDFPARREICDSFALKVKEVTFRGKIYKVEGKVKVLDFLKKRVIYGEELILKGRLSKTYGELSYQTYLRQKGIYSVLTVGKSGFIKQTGKKRYNLLKYLAFKIRTRNITLLFKYLPSPQAGIFSAMLLGERSYISPYFNRLFIQTGTVHILAISGLHIGIIGFILNIFLKTLRLKRRLRYILIIFFLIFYCFLTGLRTPVIRATVMAIVLLFGFFLRRQARISHSLSICCLLILILRPSEIFDISFQLSFLSVISIVYLSPKIKDFLFGEKFKKNRTPRFFSDAFSISLSWWLGLSPFIFYHFKIISFMPIFVNILIIPYLSVVIALGICLLFFGSFSPFLASIFAQSANLSIVLLIKMIELFSKVPFSYFYIK